MSRAMCFRVTNSDLGEQLTVRGGTVDEAQSSKPKQKRPLTGKDLQRKYMEIMKNNYADFEDVEDDEELIDRIMQLAEDSDDTTYLQAEDDSITEEDSMSDNDEDDAVAPVSSSSSSQSQSKNLQRLSSHGSLHNEPIQEESEEEDDIEDSASSDESVNSADESTQQSKIDETNQTASKTKNQENGNSSANLSATTNNEPSSEAFYSPVNSIPTSPEPTRTNQQENSTNANQETPKSTATKINETKNESEQFIEAEKKVHDVNNG